MRDPDALIEIAQDAVETALSSGAHQAEAYVTEGRRVRVACEGEYARPKESQGLGICLRVAVGGSLGTASSSGLHRVGTVASEAVERAERSPSHPRFEAFAAPPPGTRDPVRVSKEMRVPDPERLEGLVREALVGVDSSETTYRSVTMSSGWRRFAVANDRGLVSWDHRASEILKLEARFGRGGREVSAKDRAGSAVPLDQEIDIEGFGGDVRERGRRSLDPQELNEPVEAVVLRPGPAGQMSRKLAAALRGDLAQTGQSPLAEDRGDAVASSAVTLTDEPHGPDVRDRARVDGEGVPTERTKLIRDGVLRSFLHDTTSGYADGGGSTGNARRTGGWQGGVSIGPSYLVLEPSDRGEEALLAEVDRAVLVPDPFQSIFTTQVTTGEFSLVAPYAFLVEGGEIATPLTHTTVAGNVLDLFENVVGVGSDARSFAGGRFPTLVADGGVTCAT